MDDSCQSIFCFVLFDEEMMSHFDSFLETEVQDSFRNETNTKSAHFGKVRDSFKTKNKKPTKKLGIQTFTFLSLDLTIKLT